MDLFRRFKKAPPVSREDFASSLRVLSCRCGFRATVQGYKAPEGWGYSYFYQTWFCKTCIDNNVLPPKPSVGDVALKVAKEVPKYISNLRSRGRMSWLCFMSDVERKP